MCRLAAYSGPPLSPATLLYEGEHSLYRQSWAPQEMLSGSVNADGVGVGWYTDGRPVRLLSDRPVWHTPAHRPLLESVRSETVVASVRNATVGLAIDMSSVAPLAHDRWTFTLNGYVTRFRPEFMRAFRSHLADDLYGELGGSSDTETLFYLLVERLRGGTPPGDAVADLVRWVIARVREKGLTTQLNVVLTDGDGLWATRAGSTERSNSLYWTRSWARAPEGVVLASEALDGGSWQTVPDASLVSVRGTRVEITPL